MNERQAVTGESTQALSPWVDIYEEETGITLRAYLPGVNKDKLTLRVDNDTLLIEGEATLDMPQNMEMIYAELRLPRYRRSFTLSRELATDKIEANLKDGVLAIRMRPGNLWLRVGSISIIAHPARSPALNQAASKLTSICLYSQAGDCWPQMFMRTRTASLYGLRRQG
jgi:HSP20 family protein